MRNLVVRYIEGARTSESVQGATIGSCFKTTCITKHVFFFVDYVNRVGRVIHREWRRICTGRNVSTIVFRIKRDLAFLVLMFIQNHSCTEVLGVCFHRFKAHVIRALISYSIFFRGWSVIEHFCDFFNHQIWRQARFTRLLLHLGFLTSLLMRNLLCKWNLERLQIAFLRADIGSSRALFIQIWWILLKLF